MDGAEVILYLKENLPEFCALSVEQSYPDEMRIKVVAADFKRVCLLLHKLLASAVMMLWANDERVAADIFEINALFIDFKSRQWIVVAIDISAQHPVFDSLAKSMHSAVNFEREIWEMFGIEPNDHLDLRRLNLHDEVWPTGNFPLRKDFKFTVGGDLNDYKFNRVEGGGIFEVPVGPVHAGIIGSGHFRFSVAGEPIVNLETRLGFTHRGVEKIFEGKSCVAALQLAECIAGDSAFAYSVAFATAVEKISSLRINCQAAYFRGIFLELERMYNHVNDIGGMALDVGFSFPAAYAALLKEAILQLNAQLTGSRYLKKFNAIGGPVLNWDNAKQRLLAESLLKIKKDFNELVKILNSSVSFMDRVDTTGTLMRKTALNLGVVGLAARSSGIGMDLRKYFSDIYDRANFKMIIQEGGDVLARLQLRFLEFFESCRLIEEFMRSLRNDAAVKVAPVFKLASALGYVEGARGPVLCWIKIDASGIIQRCKWVDPSIHNWQALSYAVLGDIIPDFPLCNKSFNLSYSGNDL